MILIDGFRFDFVKAETYDFANEITDVPVEASADKSDNIRPKQMGLSIESVHSDSPLGTVPPEDTLPTAAGIAKLLSLKSKRGVVTVVASLGTFENMALESLSIPRDERTGRALRFSARFKQIDIAESEETFIEVALPIVAHKKNVGQKDPVEVLYKEDGKPAVKATIDPATYYKNESPMAAKMRAGRLPTAIGGGSGPGPTLDEILARSK